MKLMNLVRTTKGTIIKDKEPIAKVKKARPMNMVMILNRRRVVSQMESLLKIWC